MGDYQCRLCQDRGDCNNCSWFFERDEVHGACGAPWRDHPWSGRGGYHDCPTTADPTAARDA